MGNPKPETRLVKKLRERLREKWGATSHKVHGSVYSEAGASDLYGTLPGGRALYVEVKMPGKKATPAQAAWLDAERRLGAAAGTVSSVEELDDLVGRALSTGND